MATDGSTGGQPGYPNLKSGAEGWKPGQSGNPTGVSKYLAELRQAIEGQEDVEKVLSVVAAMREDAIAHEKYSPAAAKVYFGAVGIRLDAAQSTKIDLSDAPDAVMDYLRGKLTH